MTEPRRVREEIDTCGYCTLRTFAGITVRSIQPGCPEHSGRDSTGPRRVRTQVERDADGVAWRHHEHGERISDGRPGLLPPVPDCCYPPDAVDLPEPRRRWWHRLTRRNP